MGQGSQRRNANGRALNLAALVLLIVLPLLNAAVVISPTTVTAADAASLQVSSDQLMVQFTDTATASDIAAAIASVNGTDVQTLSDIQTHEVDVPAGTAASAITTLQSNPVVVNAQQTVTMQTASIPNDPGYSNQWALPKIAWDQTYGSITPSGSARIAVLDTGVDASHPDLSGVVDSANSISEVGGNPTSDPNGHGTEMAGIAAASVNNSTGMAGVDYAGASVSSVQVLGADGTGTDANVTAGVLWAADNGANVILMSLYSTGYSDALADAVNYAESKGALVVAATGNGGLGVPTYPAGLPGVLGVAATDQNDNVLTSSDLVSADVAAPGQSIYATQPGGNYGYVTGTSPAAAEAAGLAGLLFANGDNATQAYNQITGNSDPIAGQSFGRINVLNALGGPPATVTPQPTVSSTPQPVPSPTYVAGALGVSATFGSNGGSSTITGTGSGTNANKIYQFSYTSPAPATTYYQPCQTGTNGTPPVSNTFTIPAGAPSGTWAVTLDEYNASGLCADDGSGQSKRSANTTATATNASIGGTVYNDLNGNGSFDTGEPGLSGVTVTLSGGATGTTTTNSSGGYSFTVTPASGGTNYTVTYAVPTNFVNTGASTSITVNGLKPGQASTGDNFFAQQRNASISGTLYDDLNGNGSLDTGEPTLSGVTVSLSGTSTASTTTNGSGQYTFSNLAAGSYSVTDTAPANYQNTGTNPLPVTLTAGQSSTGNNLFAKPLATHLAFSQQPTNTTVGTAISPAVTVNILGAANELVKYSTASVSLAITANTGTPGATLTGGGATAAIGGVATFSSLKVDTAGTNYTLTATSGALTSAVSSPFNVTTNGPTVTLSVNTASPGTAMTVSNNVTVHYTSNGTAKTSALWDGQTVTTEVDIGTTVTFDTNSSSPPANERWQASGTTSFTVQSTSTAFSVTYYDQLNVTFSASTATGGTAMTSANSATVSYKSLGANTTSSGIYDGTSSTANWVDRGSTATFNNSSGSTSSERWAPSTATATITGAGTVSATYYDQLANVVFGASVAAGGNALSSTNSVSATYKVFGSSTSASPLYAASGTGSVTAAWADKGVAATFSATSTGSGSSERWQANAGATQPSITVASTSVSATYYDQLTLTVVSTCGTNTLCGSPGSTGTAFGSGVTNAGTAAFFYDRGSTANATLGSSTDSSGGTQYTFTGWSGAASGTGKTSNNITISTAATATANWVASPTVTLSVSTANSNPLSSTNTVTVHYTSGGTAKTATLWDGHSVTTPVDTGTSVTFDTASSGSTASERWQTNGTTSFTVQNTSTAFSATYYDQLSATFSATTAAGGSVMTSGNSVTAGYTQFATGATSGSIYDGHSFTDWADRGSSATLSAKSSGSTASERWQANAAGTTPSFTISAAQTYSATYYDQLTLTVTSTCGSNTSCGTPSSTGTAFGAVVSSGGVSPFYDRGSTANATLAHNTDTSGGTTYTFIGWSGDASGTGTTSSNITMSTTRTATANWATPPSAPTIGTATAGNGQVQLTWTANSNGGSPITSYTVTPYINGVAQPSLAQTFQVSSGICTGTACGATITTVQNGTTYTFTVYATNVVGNSPESGQSNAVTPTVGLCVGAASASLALCGFSLTSGFSPIKLTGQDITGNFASVSSFSVQDQQTTGSGWNVTVQASPLSCTAGIDSGCRQNDNLGGGLLSMAGPLSVGTGGSSCVSGCSSGTLTLPQGSTPFFIDNGAVKIASYAKTSGDASYTFAPGSIDGVSGHNVGLTVPAHAYATTYHTTITLTVATGP